MSPPNPSRWSHERIVLATDNELFPASTLDLSSESELQVLGELAVRQTISRLTTQRP